MNTKFLWPLLGFSLALPVQAATDPLPNPFTLDDALNWSLTADPHFLRQQAIQQINRAEQDATSAEQGISLGFVGRLGQREFMDERQDYNLAALQFSAPLYDFGRTQSVLAALAIESEAHEQLLHYQTLQYRLTLMQRVFDVLLADLNYRVKNEAMAIAFVTLDKVEEDFALERVSELKLTESQREYQTAFLARQQAQLMMRQSRLRLGNALGLGATIVPRVEVPSEIQLPLTLDTLDVYQQRLEQQNPLLVALDKQYSAQQQRVDVARSGLKPTIRADAKVGQLSSYPRTREGRWEAGITFELPLYDSGLTRAKVDKAISKVTIAQAERDYQAQLLRDQLTQLYFELSLLGVEGQLLTAKQNFASVNFDVARAMYENELQADFGHSLVEISQSDYDELAFRFRKVLLWAQLNLLLGAEDLLNFDQMIKESAND
ncbi:transporter [Thiomicrospira aerophila AL3]|uniref:Transporter n=1 Tax=Thiomicrospira aerophila AL3 TaxID=717772 RepID=W0DX63_9GAMM|nr:TolC family protein [Thiomicrospira aerophila]AHF01466.1 transporter [Thiomicrospira aerophila AL3]